MARRSLSSTAACDVVRPRRLQDRITPLFVATYTFAFDAVDGSSKLTADEFTEIKVILPRFAALFPDRL